MLEWAWSRPPLVRVLQQHLGLERPFQGLYLSDLHCSWWSGSLLTQLTSLIESLDPQALLLGGDLVDLPWGYAQLGPWLEQQLERRLVLATPGNHDHWAGLPKLKSSLPPIRWLDQEPFQWPQGPRLCGHPRQGGGPTSVLVGHHPAEVRQAAQQGFPLMLAGHWHGCQWIAFQRRGLDYPGAWFFPYHGPQFQVGPTSLHVSRGVSDTLPLRWKCPRDVVTLELS